jgi:hypothetical protein
MIDEDQPDIEDDKNTGVDKTAGMDNNPTLVDTVQEDMDVQYGERTGRHNLRPKRKPNEKYLSAM